MIATQAAPPPDDVVLRAKRGDPASLRALDARLGPVIFARVRRVIARQRVVPLSEVADLAHEVWLALIADDWRRLLSWDPNRGSTLEGYVGLLAEREVLNILELRAAKKRGGGRMHVALSAVEGVQDEEGSPEDHAVARDLAEQLQARLAAALPERGRLVLAMLYRDGRTVEETASAMGVEKQVVYNWQHRIRALAREFLESR